MIRAFIKTPDGVFKACYSEHGLCRLEFPKSSARSKKPPVASNHFSARQKGWLKRTEAALREALAGNKPGRLPPLDLTAGTVFQQRVWAALRRIPPGQTFSYSEVARALGQSNAARALGQACGANPIPVLIPCHRVLAAGGGWGGFSGGLEWKIKLLAREKTGGSRGAAHRLESI